MFTLRGDFLHFVTCKHEISNTKAENNKNMFSIWSHRRIPLPIQNALKMCSFNHNTHWCD